MREIGPVRKGLNGDTETAAAQLGIARTQLGILKNLMKLGGLKVGSRTVRLADGTTIQVMSFNGQDFINIETAVPTIILPVDTPVDIPVEQVDVPEVPPVYQPLALFNAILEPDSDNGVFFRPMYLNDKLLTAPDSTPRTLFPAGAPAVRYRRGVDSSGDILVGRIDSALQYPLGINEQPFALVITSEHGKQISPDNITTSAVVDSLKLKTKPPGLGYFSIPNVLLDTTYLIDGQSKNGASQVKGVFMAQKSIQPAFASNFEAGLQVHAAADGLISTLTVTEPSSIPLFPSYPLYLMTTDPSVANSLHLKLPNQNEAFTPAGGVGAYTPFADGSAEPAWVQSGGNLTLTVGTASGWNGLNGVTPAAYGVYTATGSLTFYDTAGNSVEISVAITLNYVHG